VVATEQRVPKSKARAGATPAATDLPYSIDLLNDETGAEERVLARAQTSSLARVIFKAACLEYPARTLALKRGTRLVAKREGSA
jgi:hypothetical protein